MKSPEVKQEYFPLGGGLDLVTPQIALSSGKVFDAQNYEPEISGGYGRIWGFERADGRPSPSSAKYWTLTVNTTGTFAAGNTITGATSGATARVLAVASGKLIVGRVSGTFQIGENLNVSGVSQGVSQSIAQISGETDPSLDADYLLLAANDYRADIGALPGSGPVRGVAIYNDTLYAWRDNAGGTQSLMYKATASGWQQINFGNQITFNTGLVAPTVGQTIKGATSGATGTVVAVLLRTGTWGSAGTGSIVYTAVSGTFTNGELIKDNSLTTTYCTATSAGAAITRQPGGYIEYVNANFTGSTTTLKMYGVDGVNPAFEFDGTNYIPILTGMANDKPTHVIFHKYSLFLSFSASVQYSALGNPYGWSLVTGAGEFATGDEVTGFMPQGGNAAGSTLGIFTKIRTYMLYGSSSADYKLVASVFELGYASKTLQPVSNNTYGLTPRGIQSLITTLTYGDFDYESISFPISPLMVSKRGLETCSTSLRQKDQYRLYFNDGTGIVLGLTGDKVSGIMPLNYGKVVRCITTQTLSTGNEVTYFGSDDGYVYLDSTGTSFDGQPIESWIRPAFNHSKSPQVRKRYRRAVLEVKPFGFSKIDISYDLGYASPDVAPPTTFTNKSIYGGGYWDQFYWESFTWDARIYNTVSLSLTGTEKNISFLFYSNRAQDSKHVVQGITLTYSPQRLER